MFRKKIKASKSWIYDQLPKNISPQISLNKSTWKNKLTVKYRLNAEKEVLKVSSDPSKSLLEKKLETSIGAVSTQTYKLFTKFTLLSYKNNIPL